VQVLGLTSLKTKGVCLQGQSPVKYTQRPLGFAVRSKETKPLMFRKKYRLSK